MAENPLLRHQTLTILQQIEELKNWHRSQQLKSNNGNTSDSNESSFEEICRRDRAQIRAGKVGQRNENPSLVPQQNFDEIPIKVPNPRFEDIIENSIIKHDFQPGKTYEIKEKPKFIFLKKGEGIARFRMKPIKKPKSSSKTKLNLSIANDKKISDKELHSIKNIENKNEIPTLKPPDLKLDLKDWRNAFDNGKAEEIIERAIDNNQLELFEPSSSIDSSTASIMEKVISVGRKHLEKRVFETMEQHILDSSFCSTSSYVTKLMENAIISTPTKKSFSNRNSLANISQINQQTASVINQEVQVIPNQNVIENTRSEQALWTKPDNGNSLDKPPSIEVDDLDQSVHVRFADKVDYKSFVDQSQSLNNSNQKKIDVINFDDNKEWKDESLDSSSCCSQCSTRYSSSDEDDIPESPLGKSPTSQNCQAKLQGPKCDAVKYKRRTSGEVLKTGNVNTNIISDSQNTSDNGTDMVPSVLGSKLKELENEIQIFRTENSKLKKLRENLEKEQKKFLQEKKIFLIEIEEEKKKNSAYFEEEKQKLAKEKFIFEKYSKSVTKNPTKENRKEMQALKEQLREIKEELNKKESRWGAAQARVRNQVKFLEEDNKKLREEIEILRKQAKQLEFLTHKKKGKYLNNTKLIHAINDHISNINLEDNNTEEVKKSGQGYFNSKTSSANVVIISEVANPVNENSVKVIKEYSSKPQSVSTANYNYEASLPSHESAKVCELPSREIKSYLQNEVISRGEKIDNSDSSKDNVSHLLSNVEESQVSTKEISQNAVHETINADGKVERVFPDGKKEIRYKNGNVKKIDTLTDSEKTIYFNGDVEEIMKDGTIKYYFSESRIWHTTLPDRLEMYDFPNGQVEKRHVSGMVEILYPNNCKKLSYPDGSEEIYYADGTTLRIEENKRKVLSLPNGQKEIHTDESIRREYPDGTIKIVYPDGTMETIYSNGRVRLKDKDGNLVMDSGSGRNC